MAALPRPEAVARNASRCSRGHDRQHDRRVMPSSPGCEVRPGLSDARTTRTPEREPELRAHQEFCVEDP